MTLSNNEQRKCFKACQDSLNGKPCPCNNTNFNRKMRIQITYIVENDNWTDEEYDEKSERTVILEQSDIINAIERLIVLEEGEYIEDIYSAKEVNR